MALKFDTTGTQQNSPGLTYVTPKEMPASYNGVADAIKGAAEMIPQITAFDKKNTLEEAGERANILAEEYKTGSETYINNLNQEKLRLNSDLKQGKGDSSLITARLTELESKLTNAENQGLIGPGEFKHRFMMEAQSLSNENPAYQAEIAAKMNSVFNATGVTDILAMDSTLLNTRVAAQIAAKKDKITNVEQYQSASNMTDEELNYANDFYTNLAGGQKLLEEQLGALTDADNFQKAQYYQAFKSNGGFKTLADVTWTTLAQEMRAIGSSDRTIDQKIRESNDALAKVKMDILGVVSVLPKDAPEGALVTGQLLKHLEAIQTEMLAETQGDNRLKVAENSLKILQTISETELIKDYDMPRINALYKLFTINDKLLGESLQAIDRKSSSQSKILQFIGSQFDGRQGIEAGDPAADGSANAESATRISALTRGIREEALKDIKTNGRLNDKYLGLYITDLSLPASFMSKDKLTSFFDKNFTPGIMAIQPEVLVELQSSPEWNSNLDTNLTTYTNSARQALFNIVGENETNLAIDSRTGLLYLPATTASTMAPTEAQRIRNALNRVTNIVKINSKISGKSLKEEAIKVLDEDFSGMFSMGKD